MSTKKPIHVVAAVIRNASDEILLAKRPEHLHQGGKWEFPGGKVESGEGAVNALVRECQEELGITPDEFTPLLTVSHDYGDKFVFLDVWEVASFSGEPFGREQQRIQWFTADAVQKLEFPDANGPILERLAKDYP